MSISYRRINVLNKLDTEVKCATTVNGFKNNFRAQLQCNYIKECLKFKVYLKTKLAVHCILIWYLLSEMLNTCSTDIM